MRFKSESDLDLGRTWSKGTEHTDPEQRIGFFECHRGSEDILVILECVQNLRKRSRNVSNSTFLEIHKNIFEKNL